MDEDMKTAPAELVDRGMVDLAVREMATTRHRYKLDGSAEHDGILARAAILAAARFLLRQAGNVNALQGAPFYPDAPEAYIPSGEG